MSNHFSVLFSVVLMAPSNKIINRTVFNPLAKDDSLSFLADMLNVNGTSDTDGYLPSSHLSGGGELSDEVVPKDSAKLLMPKLRSRVNC